MDMTSRIRGQLNLPMIRRELLQIRTFGATEAQNASCDVVELDVVPEGNETLRLTALVCPLYL